MGKKDNILFISLGRSPAVITETLDALIENDIYIKRTYIVTTSDETIVNECIPLLKRDFQKHYQPKKMQLKAYQCMLPNNDILTEEDNLKLMINVSNLFKIEKGNNIYISLAGGRKTMSAAMALLAQIYSARAITHVLVSDEIERLGNIFSLKNLNENEIEEALHPKEKNLIFFPVIGISWMLSDIIKALRGEDIPDSRQETRKILIENGLLTDDFKPTRLGDLLFKLINDIERYPEPSLLEPKDKLQYSQIEIKNGPKDTLKFATKLAIVPFIRKITLLRYKNSSQTRINDIDSEGNISCQFSDGNLAYDMRIETTAKTRGETEMVRMYMSSFFN